MDSFPLTNILNKENSKKLTNVLPSQLEEETISENVDVSTIDSKTVHNDSKSKKGDFKKEKKPKYRKQRSVKPAKDDDTIDTKSVDSASSKSSGASSKSEESKDSGSESGSESDSGMSNMDDNREKQSKSDRFNQLTEMRREYINRINRFRHMSGFLVPNLEGDESIDKLAMIYDTLKYEQRYKSNIRFYRLIIGFIGWIIEQVSVRIGFSSVKNFATHVRNEIAEFDEFYEEFSAPIWVKNEEGEYVKVEKSNIITYMTSRPEIGLLTRFGTMVTAYSFANKIDTLAELIGD